MVSYYVEQMTKMRNQPLKANFSVKDRQKIIDAFDYRVMKISQKTIMIKDSKYGYEFFKSQQDDKYWAYAVTYTEPINPQSPKYKHHWMGNAIVGYGFDKLEDTIAKVWAMMASGPTSTPPVRDYLCDWDEERDRIILDWDVYKLDYQTYYNFFKWFTKNRIRIMVKNKNIKDAEDYSKEEKPSALSVLMGKMQEPPKRPRQMVTIIVPPEQKLKVPSDNTQKSYIVGFLYT